MKALLAALLLLLAAPALADNGTCVVPLQTHQRVVGRQIMYSVLVELQSPGAIYVCADMPDGMASTRVVLRRQVPNESGYTDAVIDACVSMIDMGTHPVDSFTRMQLRDTAGSFQCVVGPDENGDWQMTPARKQVYMATWYLTP